MFEQAFRFVRKSDTTEQHCSIELLKPHDCAYYWPWLAKVPCGNMMPVDVLSMCLNGQAFMVRGIVNEECVGILVYKLETPVALSIQALFLPNHMLIFRDAFYAACKQSGIKHVYLLSRDPDAVVERAYGVKRIWSVYSKEL